MTSKGLGVTSPRPPLPFVSKTLNLGKWKKDTSDSRTNGPCDQYEVIGQGGSRDGVLLSRGEPFQRTWTILNAAAFTSKSKSRVAKLVQTSGPPLKESLLFLWPPPGKAVEVTLDLTAPDQPGWFEGVWKLEGTEQEDEFRIKFEVLDIEFLVPSENESAPEEDNEKLSKSKKKTKSDQNKKGRRRKKRRTESRDKDRRNQLTSVHHSSVSTSAISSPSTSLRHLDPLEGDTLSEEPMKVTQVRSLDLGSSSSTPKRRLEEEEDFSEQFLRELNQTPPQEASDGPRISVRGKRSNTLPSAIPSAIPPSPLRLTVFKNRSDFPTPEPIIADIPMMPTILEPESSTPRRASLVHRWQETVMNDETFKRTQFEKQRKALYIQRASSLLNTHIRKKSQLLSLSPSLRTPERSRSRSSLAISFHEQEEEQLKAPSELVETAQNQLDQIIQLGQAFQQSLDQLSPYFPHDRSLSPFLSCTEPIRTLLPLLAQSQQKLHEALDQPSGETRLPSDLWVTVFSYLSPMDLCRVSQTCSSWYTLARQDPLWQHHYYQLNTPPVLPECQFVTAKTKQRDLYKAEMLFAQWETCAVMNSTPLVQTEPIVNLESAMWPVYDLQFAGNSLVTVSEEITVIDPKRRRIRTKLAGHEKVIQCVHLDRRGERCTTGSLDKTVKLWSLSQEECLHTFEGHMGAINDVTQVGDVIVSASMQDRTVRFWNSQNGECLYELPSKEGVTCLAVDPVCAPAHVFMGTVDGEVIQWDVEAQQVVQSRQVATGMVEDLQLSDDLIIASDYTRIIVQSLHDASLECLSPMMNRNVGRLQKSAYSLGAQVGNKLNLFDVRYLFERHLEFPVDGIWKGAFCFHPDGELLIGAGNGQVYQWPGPRKF